MIIPWKEFLLTVLAIIVGCVFVAMMVEAVI